ncbi:N-acetylmuramoyl-L-alanine amidase family protein [Xiamenia xianingshaonis]|uniref:N-acetylmuramoyl-L-alanine amidase family protein n=1 Tax=Xiamenia xianingshaonis TaxID=2682776 RepID=UPI00140E8946|nr:N-acetylmuramoyl-L-alanine amidase family protein [Xiamenia xianingshaonis]
MNTINLTGCTVTGPTGIEGKYTNMTLTDCIVEATKRVDDAGFSQTGNGSTSQGFAVVSTDNSVKPDSPKPEATITINGGEYRGLIGLSQLIDKVQYPGFTEAAYSITGGAFDHDPNAYTNGVKYAPNAAGLYVKCEHYRTPTTTTGAHSPTCGAPGSTGTTVCDTCGRVVAYSFPIPATGEHTYGEWAVVEEATEFEPGEQERSCSVCGEKETQEVPALGHAPSAAWKSDATDHWKVCEGCGAELEKASHDYGEWRTTKDATEQEPGEKARSCSVCGATETEELPALGHKPSASWQSNATDHWKACERCGAELEKAPHAYGDWTVTKEATEQEAGFRERSCSACGYVQAEETEKLSPAAPMPEGGSGWVESDDGEWGYVEAGEPVEEGWKEVDGSWYYFEEESMQTGWKEVGGDWYYLEESRGGAEGSMATGWKEVDGGWYYLEDTGKMATGWAEVGGEWYHLEKSGRMDTGWKQDGGTWYYLNGAGEGVEGAMATGWKKVDGEWYYLAGSGAMRSGWQRLSGVWYLLNARHDGTFGRMLEGWQRVDAKTGVPTSADSWYYLNPGSGAMAANRWVGGYYVDASGLWVR